MFVSLYFFILLADNLLSKLLFFLKGDSTQNPETLKSVTTRAKSGKAQLTDCKFGVKCLANLYAITPLL